MTNTEMRHCPKCVDGLLSFTKDMGIIKCDNCDYERLPIDAQATLPSTAVIELKTCPECGREVGKMGFPSHMASHRRRKNKRSKKQVIPEVTETKPEATEAKPLHICLICDKKFPTQQSLAGHMSSHKKADNDVLTILDNTERLIRTNIMRASGDIKNRYIDVRMYILQAIDVMIR